MQPFQRGIGVQLHESGVKAVPVGIHGSFAALPRTRTFPRLRRITIEFGWPKAIDTLIAEGQGDDADQRCARALRERPDRLTDILKYQLRRASLFFHAELRS